MMILENTIVDDLIKKVSPYSMVHESGIRFTIEQVVSAIHQNLQGVFVECGVWRGGCSLAMLLAQRMLFGNVIKPVYMLDSFMGLPKVEEKDGPLARDWQAGADPQKFFDNCSIAETELYQVLEKFDFKIGTDCFVIKGLFNITVPHLAKKLKNDAIALLRLDGDWYSSTKVCLEFLVSLVVEEGIVIIDDYYAWDGCARAVHEFLAEKDLPYRIKSLYNYYGGYFVKRLFRKQFEVF